MKILSVELSSARGSLACLDNESDAVVREWANDRKHSGLFFENLESVSKKFGPPEKIIVGLGPGSYAGVRIAISAAIGLSFAGGTGSVPSHNLGRHGGRPSFELLGFPSICAMECETKEYCVIGDARRKSFFLARIRDRNLVEGPTLLSEAELRDRLNELEANMSIFSSEGLPQFQRAEIRYPSALELARLARDEDRSFSTPPLEPIYLREPHITMPRSLTVAL